MPSATEEKIVYNVVGEASCIRANKHTILFLHCFVLEVHVTAFYTCMGISKVTLGTFLK